MKLNKRLVIFLLIVIALSLLSIYYPYLKPTGQVTNINYKKEPATFLRIVDGDTIHALVNGQDETIRLLGINNLKV
jgi:endonuclease YncB( thermonuclease family)